ncbi:hypothetical protein EBZ80_02335 [bacterium]|nr:hypothetical protein [bacterium]
MSEGQTGLVALIVHEGRFLALLLSRLPGKPLLTVLLEMRVIWMRLSMLSQHVLMDASERLVLFLAARDYRLTATMILVFFAAWARRRMSFLKNETNLKASER